MTEEQHIYKISETNRPKNVGNHSIVIGVNIDCKHEYCVCIGENIKTTGDYQIWIGGKQFDSSFHQMNQDEFHELRNHLRIGFASLFRIIPLEKSYD